MKWMCQVRPVQEIVAPPDAVKLQIARQQNKKKLLKDIKLRLKSVRHFCVCIGSPCLRQWVHGASTGGLQPLGLGIGGCALCIGYCVDRFCAERASPLALARLRQGAGAGDLSDGHVACTPPRVSVLSCVVSGRASSECMGGC